MKHAGFLFITRNFPPQVGGLENYSYHLIKEFEKRFSICKISLGRPRIHLIWFLPYCCLKALYLWHRYKLQTIHLCDGLLAPVGILLKWTTRARISITVHGLDITYPLALYQKLIPACIARLDKIICVSHSTRDECVRRKIPEPKCRVILNGIDPAEFELSETDRGKQLLLAELLPSGSKGGKLLLSVGRLVKRKGIRWFIECVMTHLGEEYRYVVAGQGPESAKIRASVRMLGLENRVFVLGRVSDTTRKLLYHSADMFIMPNIECPNDVEGFGITAIEAGICGLPVVASNLQGLRDAVLNEKTGYLVAPGDPEGFVDCITSMRLQNESVREMVHETFNWTTIGRRYYKVLTEEGHYQVDIG